MTTELFLVAVVRVIAGVFILGVWVLAIKKRSWFGAEYAEVVERAMNLGCAVTEAALLWPVALAFLAMPPSIMPALHQGNGIDIAGYALFAAVFFYGLGWVRSGRQYQLSDPLPFIVIVAMLALLMLGLS